MNGQQREDQDTSSHTYEDVDGVKRHATSAGFANDLAPVGVWCFVKGATPMLQPEPYWRSRADAAAKIPNPMYASNAGTTPMLQPQSLRSRADAVAKIPNPIYASHAGATRMRLPQSCWRSLANATAKMLNPMYASSSADPPKDQPQTNNQAPANDAENTPDVTYATTIPADPPTDQPQTDYQARANDAENTPDATYATIPDDAYPGGASGRRGVCSFLRARRSCLLAAGIAVLLGLVAVGLAPLTFSNKQEISQLSTAFDALKGDEDTLKRIQDDVRQLSATVDALKRDKNALKRDQGALKRELDNERNRTAALEQGLLELNKTLLSCPEGYTLWRRTCYKAFDTLETFSDAAGACRDDFGTLAMPRDAETNAFLISLYKSVSDDRGFWIGLHDQRVEGRFEWVDGSALGKYNSWAPGNPSDHLDTFASMEDCVAYSAYPSAYCTWKDERCNTKYHFICQASPVEMYEQAEPVRSPFSGPDSPQPSGPPPQPRPVHQSGSRGRVRHGNGASDHDKQREDQDTSSHTYENAEEAKRYATSADGAYPGGPSGRRGVCSFLRARRSFVAAGIAVLLSLIAVGLAPLTFSNRQEILQLKRDQDGMSTAVDDLKRELDNERSRIATLEQRLHKIEKTLRYTKWREICYKAFNTRKTFSDAAAACRADGGTLAMPRDAETNAFLITLYNSVCTNGHFWFGLHDQGEEGRFEWVDGSALGPYSSWGDEEPSKYGGRYDCVLYSSSRKDKWSDYPCHRTFPFICQATPGRA
ncbi:hypothetical protein Bbelb_307160 [Branchiostoma belcheri]|nr:hypothetical protein Bbelb_307160 [Branchiostoma belcheri]